MKKRGRKNVLEEGFKLDEFIENYRKHKTAKATGIAMGLSEKTVRKYLKIAGTSLKKGPRRGGAQPKKGCYAKWLRKNTKSVSIPRSIKEISSISGCTEDQIKTFLYRGKKELKKYLQGLVDLRKLRGRLDKVPLKAIKSYRFFIDRFSLEVTLIVTLHPYDKRMEFTVTKEILNGIIRKGKEN